jgi:hypothetical protein
MPAFRLYRISDPTVLKSVAPLRLLRFLTLFKTYLESRGFNWPQPDVPAIDYDTLSRILLSPDDSLPSQMVRTLVFVDEMSIDDRMDQLLAACAMEKVVLDLGPDCTPADVAIQTWFQAPEILERQHAGAYALRQRSFHYFAGARRRPKPFPQLSKETLQHLTDDLDDGFEAHKRGREARVMVFDHRRRAWIVVRRGATFKQEGSTKIARARCSSIALRSTMSSSTTPRAICLRSMPTRSGCEICTERALAPTSSATRTTFRQANGSCSTHSSATDQRAATAETSTALRRSSSSKCNATGSTSCMRSISRKPMIYSKHSAAAGFRSCAAAV